MNKVILIGELTREALKRETDYGDVYGFSIKTIERFKGREKVAFHDCNAWGEKGDALAGARVGAKVLVEGKITYRPREVGDQKIWVAGITVDSVELIGGAATTAKTERPNKEREKVDDIPF